MDASRSIDRVIPVGWIDGVVVPRRVGVVEAVDRTQSSAKEALSSDTTRGT